MAEKTRESEGLEALALYEEHQSMRAGAAAMGLSLGAFHRRVEMGRALRASPEPGFEPYEHGVQTDKDGNVKSRSTKSRKVRSKPTEGAPEGMSLHRLSTLKDSEGKVIQEWRIMTKGSQSPTDMIKAFKDEAEFEIPRVGEIEAPTESFDRDLLNLVPLADQHHGAYAWAPEAGEDYDIDISGKLLKEHVKRVFDLMPKAETCVVLGLGDFFHTDTERAETYYSGNALDRDGRQGKVVLSGVKLLRWTVEEALKTHINVHVVIKAGNHDPMAALYLAMMLEIAFEKNPRVIVDIDPSLFWFATWGDTLLAATHGHTVKPKRMPAMMSTEAASAWGESNFRYGFQGHIHHETTTAEEDGAIVHTFQTLAARDAWHANRFPRVIRSISGLTFHREGGRVNWATSPVKAALRGDRVISL